MADNTIKIEVIGMDKLRAALKKFPTEAKHYLKGAGEEATRDVILKTPGLGGMGEKSYPPAPPGSRPPAPYYQRGVGMIYKSGPGKATSEKLGTQWTVESSDFKTTISNRTSYARYVIGEEQAGAMGRIGWRKLVEVAREKSAQITVIYNKWVDKLLRDLKL